MRNRWIKIGLIVVFLIWATPVQADGWDDLFGDDPFGEEVTVTDEGSDVDHALALLQRDLVEWGGRFSAQLGLTQPLESEYVDLDRDWSASAQGQLYLDIRPRIDTRFFLKGTAQLEQDTRDDWQLEGQMLEWFADWNFNNQLYLRAGKQNVKWGVGYFFSPADVINIGRINPEKPEAEREGPTALRIHWPERRQDYHLFVLADGLSGWEDIAIAPRATFVVGRSEVGIGGFYQQNKAPRAMLTVSSSINNIAVFGEAVFSHGSDRLFLTIDEDNQARITERDDWIFQGTVGFQFQRPDPTGMFAVGMAGQYLYDGEGYKDTSHLVRIIEVLPFEGLSQLKTSGRHQAALMANWSGMLNSNFSINALWVGDLTAENGLIRFGLSHKPWNRITPSISAVRVYQDSFHYDQLEFQLSYSISF